MASLASVGAMNISATTDSTVPMKENTMPAPKALAACPLATMGAPSRQVATELGVPGILIRMAEIRPPEIAPMYRLISRHMVLVLSIVKTMDMNTEMASVALMPGIAPKTIPTAVPRTISRRQPGVMTA